MTLEELRLKIDETDKELAAIFARRMELARQVAKAKNNAIPVLDSEREIQVRRQFLSRVPKEIEGYANTLLDTLLSVSKDYQHQTLNLS